jgi:branched-chain amino acid transport system permease protein
VLGALVVSGLDSFLSEAEQGVHVGFRLDLPEGTRLIFLAAIMALVLVLRPSGITGGRELALPRRLGPRRLGASPRERGAASA